jgi:radical SAM superfamily enzyme YgiQ (UPF0313 family)
MKYNHALFLNPYIETNTSNNMMLFPPTGLEYVATSARGLGGKVTLLDLRYENGFCDTNKLLDFISKEIDIICVSIGWNRHFKQVLHLINLMPDNIPLVIGGHKATEKVEEIFESCPKADIIVRGEGEETIKEILKGEPLENIMGISYRANGTVVHNGHRPLPNINNIVSPDRTLRRNKYYVKLRGLKVTKLTFDAVLSARGCPHKCKFCTFSLNPLGQKRSYSPRSVDSVIKEIEDISADVILFSDDDFFVDKKRAEEICDLIIEKKIEKRFIAQARLEIAKHPTLIEKMVRAGFKILLIGIESPHDHILTQLDKGFNSDTIRKSFAVLTKYPIYYHGYFIYGNIGETEEEMLYISKFAKEIGVDSITFQKLRVEQFSPLKEIVEKTPGYHISSKGILYSDTYSKKDLKKIGRKIKFSFYTPFSFWTMLRKCYVVGFFNLSEIVSFLFVSPLLLGSIVVKEIQKGRLGDSLKHIFISSN